MTRCVIFDLDGTLADTSGDLLAAANTCFSEMGVEIRLTPERHAGTALRGGRAMLRAGLSDLGDVDEGLVDQWYPRLLTAYGDALDIHTVMYPGAVDAVEALRTAGYNVGVCTNKPEGLAQSLLVSLGVRDLFGSLVGADTLPVRKPDPTPMHEAVARAGGGTALLVGDTKTDRETARAAGVPCILVTFGPGGDDVRALQPEGLLHHFDDLGAEVKRLIG